MKSKSNPFLRAVTLTASIVLSFGAAQATIYTWDGGATTTNWGDANNWNPNGTIGVYNTSGAHRLNVNSTQKLVYTSAEGTTTYANTTDRGLVIGSGTNARGEMEITGGTFSTNGSGAGDVIGNGNGSIAILTINGGNFIGSSHSAGTGLGIGGGPTCTLNVLAGSATVNTLNFNNTAGTINLNGGILAANKITRTTGSGGTLNLNGGTLKARQADAAFVTGLSAVNVNSGGAIIDTNTFDVTIGNVLRDGGGGGGLTKNSTGTLTLTAAPTYTGPTLINEGALALNPASAYTYNNTISGAGSLSIGGLVTLGGANTYLGATTVNSGTFTLNGSLTSAVTVAGGTNLSGEGSTTGTLDFNGASILSFNTSTPSALTAASIDATGASITVAPTGSTTGPGIVVLEAAGGITGVIGSEFIGNSRVSLSYNAGQTQLLATFTPAALTWKGTDETNPTFWDTEVTANWNNGGTPGNFLTGDNVLFDDSATSFTVNVQTGVIPSTVTFNHSANNYVIEGSAIGGAANLIKNGTSTLTLNTPNTYSGTTSINVGTVVLGNNTALGTSAGGTTIASGAILDMNGKSLGTEVLTISGNGDGNGALVSSGAEQINAIGRLVLAADAAIGGSSTRWDIRNTSPTLDLGGFKLSKVGTNYVGLVGVAVTNPGNIDITEGSLSVQTSTSMGGSNANVITVSSGATLSSWQASNPVGWSLNLKDGSTLRSENASNTTQNIWAGPVTLEDAGTVTIQGEATMTISGNISGTGSAITKAGNGVAFISGTNSYTGLTTVSAGSLALQNTSALGTTDEGTSVTGTARVELDNLTISGETITISGTGGNSFGALQGRAGTSVWAGNVIVDADQTRIGTQVGATLDVPGVISSDANHNVVFRPADNNSPVILSGANTFTGPSWIVGGVVSVSSLNSVVGGSPASNLGAPTTVADGTIKMSVLNGTGTLRYTGTGETSDRVIDLAAATNGAYLDQSGTGLLKFTSDLTATGAGTKNLALQGSTAGVGELAGAIVDNSATNKTTLSKSGSGTWVLSGNNTFTGNVTINVGVLKITNSNALGSGVKTATINAGNNKWLELDGSSGNITLASDISFQTSGINGVIRNTAGNNVINGNFSMTYGNGDTRIVSDNAGSLTIAGNVSASVGTRVVDFAGDSTANNVFSGVLDNANVPALTKSGVGTWILSGANTYTGATTVNGGTLILGATGSIAASASLIVAAGAELDTTAKSSHALPAAVAFGINGDAATCGLIDATGKELVINSAAVTFNVAGTLSAPVYVLANYGSISGTASFASATAPDGYTLDYAYNGGTQIALVKNAGGYADWASSNNVTGGPEGDDDGDGIKNLMEYALGLDAKVPGGSPGTFSNNTLSYTKGSGVTGVTYAIETSGTLNGDWAVVFTSPAEDATVSYTLPTGQGKIFARLKVTQP